MAEMARVKFTRAYIVFRAEALKARDFNCLAILSKLCMNFYITII